MVGNRDAVQRVVAGEAEKLGPADGLIALLGNIGDFMRASQNAALCR